ncbi:DNA methyltransferase [Pseudoxanthomonas sp. LjRoot168]|jgi:DNA modification methylase|uniref:DNA methyltransferase n=1 Tax=unclassified Pseudoxanthomonas TaxID=2645906 RepID=UPI003ECD702D
MKGSSAAQLDLFTAAVSRAYAGSPDGQLSNDQLYARVQADLGLSDTEMTAREPVGRAAKPRNLVKRRIRWAQQTLKSLGLVEPAGERGAWRVRQRTQDMPQQAPDGAALLAFSTKLGLAIWARHESVFPKLGADLDVALILTSPPYPLARQRAYEGPRGEREYIDFILRALEPIRRNLLPGGSIALNISNDIFVTGTPARSLYRERLLIELCERLSLSKADELIWSKTSAIPGPYQWASRTRQQLNAAFEPIYILTPDPTAWFADNRRCLEPHTEAHAKLIAKGGEQRSGVFSDGAYRIKPGSFGNATEGKIMRNVWPIGHRDSDVVAMNAFARKAGLQTHGAPMPYAIADRLVRWLSRVNDLVADPFAGRLTTGKAAEANGRRWLCTEAIWDHLVCGGLRFGQAIAGGDWQGSVRVDATGAIIV